MIASDTYGAVEGGGLWKSVCHLSNQMQKQISKRDVRDSIQILNHIYDILQDGIMTMYHETLLLYYEQLLHNFLCRFQSVFCCFCTVRN